MTRKVKEQFDQVMGDLNNQGGGITHIKLDLYFGTLRELKNRGFRTACMSADAENPLFIITDPNYTK